MDAITVDKLSSSQWLIPEIIGILTVWQVIAKLCRLMFSDLSLTIEPKRLARNGETISGQYAIHDMQRLCKLLHDHSGHALFSLVFTHDGEQRRFFITGDIKARLVVVCQRCLGGMEFGINSRVYLGIVDDMSEAARLPESCEPLLADPEPVSLLGLIEDELILSLPISARHDTRECMAEEINAISGVRNNPFAVLQKLKQK